MAPRSRQLLTWLDVKRLISHKTYGGTQIPAGIIRFSCFSGGLEIYLEPDTSSQAIEQLLEDWFGDWYQANGDHPRIILDLFENDFLPIELITSYPFEREISALRPLWSEVGSLDREEDAPSLSSENHPAAEIKAPRDSKPEDPTIIAFYSFKGGVGRTLHLAAYLFALGDRISSPAKGQDPSILVIDADLEAPGLTFWSQSDLHHCPISFIQFLEAYQYAPLPIDDRLKAIAHQVKKSQKTEGGTSFYFLPSFGDLSELLEMFIFPAHIARNLHQPWGYTDALIDLGKELGVRYIFVDLRAGLSEISSPLLLDPRVQRFCVTTPTSQSIGGIKLVLQQMSHVMSRLKETVALQDTPELPNHNLQQNFFDPQVILSFLTEDFRKTEDFEAIKVQLATAYRSFQEESQNPQGFGATLSPQVETGDFFQETDFAQELLHIKDWQNAREKLPGTNMWAVAQQWAEEEALSWASDDSKLTSPNGITRLDRPGEQLRRLRELCQTYEFAEEGQGNDFLVTQPLSNLAKTFGQTMPRCVIIGPKGSGKTFVYVQLAHQGTWEQFLQATHPNPREIDSSQTTYIFPLLQSTRFTAHAQEKINCARSTVAQKFGISEPYSHNHLGEQITTKLEAPGSDQTWQQFWLHAMAQALNYRFSEGAQNSTIAQVRELDRFVKEKQTRIIFTWDGLEDYFPELYTQVQQRDAVKALINLPSQVFAELRQPAIGLIIFLREDFVKAVILQNSAQFMALYQDYALRWNVVEFLKLIYWLCAQAKIDGFESSRLDQLNLESLKQALEKLWGKKLGQDHSKEAMTTRWVYAALIDFKGHLQARDVVRFVYHAADITLEKSNAVQFDYWLENRLLPPQSLRQALSPCSEKKVEQTQEEYPQFSQWVKSLQNLEAGNPFHLKRIPIRREHLPFLNIEPGLLETLQNMGVIYEYPTEQGVEYYIPEIFRLGLGFQFDRGARPRILVLQRKALGGIPL